MKSVREPVEDVMSNPIIGAENPKSIAAATELACLDTRLEPAAES